MKYLYIIILTLCCGFAYADSKEAIQARSEWINSQYEDGKMSEEDAVAEIQDLKRRALALNDPIIYQPPSTNSQKIVGVAGNSLLRQATVPGPAGWSVFRFIGGIQWANIFLWIFFGGFFALVLLGIYETLKKSTQIAEIAQQRRVQANIAANIHRDSGPSLASVMGTLPVRPVPPPRNSSQLHSGEVPDNLV